MIKTFSAEEIKKLKELVTEGIQVHQEVDALKGGLSDTVKAIAEQLDIKPATINKAIRTAYKADLEQKREDMSDLEDILVTIGRDF
jgi:DNA-binding MarR family transcriptional regulator